MPCAQQSASNSDVEELAEGQSSCPPSCSVLYSLPAQWNYVELAGHHLRGQEEFLGLLSNWHGNVTYTTKNTGIRLLKRS